MTIKLKPKLLAFVRGPTKCLAHNLNTREESSAAQMATQSKSPRICLHYLSMSSSDSQRRFSFGSFPKTPWP